MKSVLVISPYFPPQGNPQALQTWRKVKAFCWYGLEVTVLAARVDEVEGINFHVHSELPLNVEGLTVHRFPAGQPVFRKIDLLRKAYRLVRPYDTGMLLKGLQHALISLLKQHDYDVIISIAEPLASHAALLSAQAFVHKAKQVYWFSDPVPMVANANMMKLAWRRRQCEKIARLCVQHGDLIIGVTEEIINPIRTLYPQKSARFRVIPHCLDECDWPWPPQPPQRRTDSGVTLLHSGALYYTRNPFVLLEGIELTSRVLSDLPPIRVRLQGAVAPHIAQRLRAWKDRVSVDIEGPRSFVESKRAMVEADILCIIDCDLPQNVHLPSKLADYIGACRPILYIGKRNSPTYRLLTRVNHPAFAQAETPQQIPMALRSLVSKCNNVSLDEYKKVYDQFISTRVHVWVFDLIK